MNTKMKTSKQIIIYFLLIFLSLNLNIFANDSTDNSFDELTEYQSNMIGIVLLISIILFFIRIKYLINFWCFLILLGFLGEWLGITIFVDWKILEMAGSAIIILAIMPFIKTDKKWKLAEEFIFSQKIVYSIL